VLADVYARRHEYRAQMQDLDVYLKLEPNGAESEQVRQARGVVLTILASPIPKSDFGQNMKVPLNTPQNATGANPQSAELELTATKTEFRRWRACARRSRRGGRREKEGWRRRDS